MSRPKWTLEQRQAQSLRQTGRKLSDETKLKIGEINREHALLRPMAKGMKTRKEHVFVDGVESKECCLCDKVKPLTEFANDKNARWDGLTSSCKRCRALRNAKYKQGDV